MKSLLEGLSHTIALLGLHLDERLSTFLFAVGLEELYVQIHVLLKLSLLLLDLVHKSLLEAH